MRTPLVDAAGIHKSFAGVRALRGVDFQLHSGEVHALVGENGAGKSTLVKVITGAVTPDSGTLRIGGQLVEANSPAKARTLGIAAIYQQPRLFPQLSVEENIAVVLEDPFAWRRVDWPKRRARAKDLLARIGAGISPETAASALSMPEQQLVEIARAIGADARVFIMDEPTASLTRRETERLFAIIAGLRQSGAGIIYISHRLEEVRAIAGRVTVLRDGSSIETRPAAGLTEAELIRLMVGRELSTIFPKREVTPGEVMLEARDLGCRAGGLRNVSFSVRAGEILGFSGLLGSGRTELADTLFGLTPADAGEIRWQGRAVRVDSPSAAIALGMGYVPEDRPRHGVIPPMSVAENVTLANLTAVSRAGFLRFARERGIAASFIERFQIKTPGPESAVSGLSGGNQQKVALSRWLATNPRLLILDEPTQGIDVGAKAEVHRMMGELAAAGIAIVMISSELPEILGMSDRIAVMAGGAVAGILDRRDATQDGILALAIQHGGTA